MLVQPTPASADRAIAGNACAGYAGKAAEWFRKLGFKLPYGVNVADFILDLASGEVPTGAMDAEEARLYLVQCQETFTAKSLAKGDGEFLGYGWGAELSEATLGTDLWRANRTVRSAAIVPHPLTLQMSLTFRARDDSS